MEPCALLLRGEGTPEPAFPVARWEGCLEPSTGQTHLRAQGISLT